MARILAASITQSVFIWHYPRATFFFFCLDRTLFNHSADSALSLSSYFLEVSDNGRGTYLCEGRRSALRAMHFICSAEIRSGRLTTPGGRNRVETSEFARRLLSATVWENGKRDRMDTEMFVPSTRFPGSSSSSPSSSLSRRRGCVEKWK